MGRGATVLVMEVDRPVTALVEAAAALVDASAEVEAIEDENELDSTAAAAKTAEVDTGVSVEDEPMVGYAVWLNVADAVVLSMEELAEDDEGLAELDVGGVGINEELGGAGVGVDELAMDKDAIESDGVTLTGVDVVVSESVGVGETRA